MEQMKLPKELMKESQVCSYEDELQKQTDNFNKSQGDLNKRDGIDCEICNNKGVIRSIVEGYPINKDCSCMIKRRSVIYAKQSGLGKLLDYKLENFKTAEPFQKAMLTKALEFIKSDKGWFVALGQSGSGKTMLCSAIARCLIGKCKRTMYIVYPTWIREVRMLLNDGGSIASWQKVEVLYIDDLFKGRTPSENDINICYELLNHRYNNALTTIISSEMLFSQLMNIDEAIAGRIKEMCEVIIEIHKDENKNFRLGEKQ